LHNKYAERRYLCKGDDEPAHNKKVALLMAHGAHTLLNNLLGLRHAAKDIELFSRRRSRSQLAGGSKTLFRGRGLEFEEVRHYQAGDELRAIDWRVTARTGIAHTKLFREERERPVFLLVDQRRSMAFGSRCCFKSVQAAEVAALLSWAALDHNDRIGGLVFNEQRHIDIRPARNRGAALHMLKALDTFSNELIAKPARSIAESAATKTTPTAINLEQMLVELRRVARPGSAVFIVSDFIDFDDASIKQLHQLARHCDINAILIYDPMEQDLPAQGAMAFTDGAQRRILNTSARGLRRDFSALFSQRIDHTRTALLRLGIELNTLSTDSDALNALTNWYRSGRNQSTPASPHQSTDSSNSKNPLGSAPGSAAS
jgi:uncharacterized protein (DUF58 family)